MSLYYIAILIAIVASIKWRRSDSIEEDFLDRSETSVINGVCILLVFVGHIDYYFLSKVGYVYDGFADMYYLWCNAHLHQLHVVPFLFFSGYGVTESIGRRVGYVSGMFKTRILATWLNYAIAVGVFAVANIVLCTGIPVVRMFATLTCFQGIGNPTWYIFCILSCYLASFVAAKVSARFSLGRTGGVFVLSLLLLGYYFFALKFGRHSGWYNTSWAYLAGCFLSVFKNSALRFARAYYYPLLVATFASFVVFYLFGSDRFALANNCAGVSMMCVILLATMKIRLDSRFLRFMGAGVYPIYLYHTLLFLIVRNVVSSTIGSIAAHMIIMASFGMSIVVASQWRRIAITLKAG